MHGGIQSALILLLRLKKVDLSYMMDAHRGKNLHGAPLLNDHLQDIAIYPGRDIQLHKCSTLHAGGQLGLRQIHHLIVQ